MTLNEQEKKVYEQVLAIKDEVETIVEFKVNKRNYKKAIVEMTRQAANDADKFIKMSAESQEKVQNFFRVCQAFLGEVIWSELDQKNLKIHISYNDKLLTSWTIPIDMFFMKEETFDASTLTIGKSFIECFTAYFLSPSFRQKVMSGDALAIKFLYDSFNRPSMTSTLHNLIMLKDNFPEFYDYITTKLDVMTVENMEQFILNKNVTRKSNKIPQGKKKRVSRVKSV